MKRRRSGISPSSVIVGIILLGYLCYSGFGSIMNSIVNARMQAGLDAAAGTGNKIVAYYVEEDEYSADYVPSAYQTTNPDDVGAIMNITKERVSQAYSGGYRVTASMIIVELIDADTGEVINSSSFYPQFPTRYRTGSAVTVDMDYVKRWVQKAWEAYLAENR